MRISSLSSWGRYTLVLGAVAASVVLLGAVKKNNFSIHEKAYYAAPSLVAYVQPGLVFKVVSATVTANGTISVDFKTTDPNGAALDRTGVITPGTVASSFLIAYIPKGQTQFTSYITRNVTAAVGGATAIQATGDSGGTYQTVADGEYIYTFGNKAPAGYDTSATHRIGIYGSRNLTEFDAGTHYASTTFNFVPDGANVRVTRRGQDPVLQQVPRRARLPRRIAQGHELCIMCHTPQTTDSGSGNTLDMKVFVHKLHNGSHLPSVQAGGKYFIVGFNNAVSDWSTVEFPTNGGGSSFPGVLKCQSCHEQNNGAAQAKAWFS